MSALLHQMKAPQMTLRKCTKCGWIHFAISRDFAENAVKEFNLFYEAATDEVKEMYGRKASIDEYVQCFRCGDSYLNFEVTESAPRGCTLQPIIDPETEKTCNAS